MPFRIFKWMVYSGFTVMVIGVIAVVAMLYQIIPTIPKLPDDLNDIFGQTTKVYAYDQEGNPFLVHTLGPQIERLAHVSVGRDEPGCSHALPPFGQVKQWYWARALGG